MKGAVTLYLGVLFEARDSTKLDNNIWTVKRGCATECIAFGPVIKDIRARSGAWGGRSKITFYRDVGPERGWNSASDKIADVCRITFYRDVGPERGWNSASDKRKSQRSALN
ncbi:hypothetical protein QE152_g9743 [Popillia japonica]|uniref:Uncharacterized protein n=1 Tax=Popillia japonica TaxID=7064 RepID=A0AAW1LTS9_POPJA